MVKLYTFRFANKMSSLSAEKWAEPVTPDRKEEIKGACTATSAAAHLFPEINCNNDIAEEVTDSDMANSVFAGGSRSVFDESNSGKFVPTADDRRKQALRSEASSNTLKNSIKILSDADLKPYLGEIATKLKAFAESNMNGNNIPASVIMGISRLKGRLLFRQSRTFEAKQALVNLGVISNPMSDDSCSEFYMYNTSFVISPQSIAPVSGASVSQLPAVVRPSSTQSPASSGGVWAKLSSTEKLSPHETLLRALDMDFNRLGDFEALKKVLSALKTATVAVEGIRAKKRADLVALLEDDDA